MRSSNEVTTRVVSSAVRKYADLPGGLLPLLHEIQAGLGFIPRDCVADIASDFHDQPRGGKIIHLCRAEACQAMGSRQLEVHVKTRLGIDYGGTTPDGRFSLEPVYCLGNCACSPSIRVGDEVYARVDADRFDKLLDEI